MSPVSKKSKDKKGGKESKNSSKHSGHVNTSSGIPASGYNPMLGTFHTLETAPVASTSPLHANGRFGKIDDTDDHNANSVNGVEYDAISNNDSWSGESEDHKDKPSQSTQRQESIPGADNDKREKIRQKNERKHQRQKERRAQELHEKCSGYLMSRKLEALAQQLVAMGFSQERATMALIMNEGRVEESITWFFEGGEEDKKMEHNDLDGGGNLKIDISEELARITDIEIRYKVSKQEVERAVVSCEGDLDKAEEMFKAQKEDPPSVSLKPEENDNPTSLANGKLPTNSNPSRIQLRSSSSTVTLQKRDDRDFNYTKPPPTAVSSSADPVPKSTQVLKKAPPKSDWIKPQQIAAPPEKRWLNGSNPPSASFSSPAPIKTEARLLTVGNELKNLQLGSVKEPVIMQRAPSINPKQVPSTSLSSSPPGTAMGWYPSSVETLRPHGFGLPQFQNQLQYPSHPQFDSTRGNGNGNPFLGRGAPPPAIAAASSLGLFSGIGVNGGSSSVDWSTGSSMSQFDYTNIDWSLDRGSLSSRPPSRFTNYSMMQDNARSYESYVYAPTMRKVLPNGNGVPIPDGAASGEATGVGSREWTSPFEEKDLFSLPRQFVSSPTL